MNERPRFVRGSYQGNHSSRLARHQQPYHPGEPSRRQILDHEPAPTVLSMVFSFDEPKTKGFTDTVRLLANLSRVVIVDITNPRSTPFELHATVPDYMVPFAPISERGQAPFAMFLDLQNKYDWVLPAIVCPSVDRLIEVLEDEIIGPAQAKSDQLFRTASQSPDRANV